MSVWGFFDLSVTGPDQDVRAMKARVNANLSYDEGSDALLFDAEKIFPGCRDWFVTQEPWSDAEFAGERRYGVPWECVERLSEEWPGLMFRFLYHMETEDIRRGYDFQAGDVTPMEYGGLFFRTARPGEPIHHYWLLCDWENGDGPAAWQALIDSSMIIDPIDDPEHEYQNEYVTRHQPEQVAEVLNKYKVIWKLMPMTLREMVFLSFQVFDVHDDKDTWQQAARICDRKIQLSEAEVQYMVVNFTLRLSAEYPWAHYDLHRFADLRHGNAGPIGEEIQCLLTMPELTAARRAELQQAYVNPPWATAWPRCPSNKAILVK